MALKMEERGISSGVQVASSLWKIPSVDSALKPGKSQPCPHLDLISVGCFKPPCLWWFLTAAIRCQNCLIHSLRTLLRKTPRFPHLFYFLEISINEVSCFSRIPVSLVAFNHTGNKHLHFLHMTKECLVWTRKEIHYPWKEIVELMEKTKQSWRQGVPDFYFWRQGNHCIFICFFFFFGNTQPLGSPLTHLLCPTPLLSPLAKYFSTPSKTEPFSDHFSVVLVFVILGQSPSISYLDALRPPSNFPDSLLNPFPSLFSTEPPERSFNNLIRSSHYLSFNPTKIFHNI